MASDDNVVRLKHIKSLAQTVTDEIANITLHGGGGSNAVLPYDADFALYVPNETSIIITGKQTPELAIGSWSYAGDIYAPPNSTKVYTAPVTYNGDGTLSTDNGTISNGVLTVHDTDGIFSGVISASTGNDFSSSSLYFNRDVENVTVDNDTDINNAIQSVGAKFVPAVDNADDFSSHANDNIQFFDNRLKKILDGGRDFVAKPCNSFVNFTATIDTLISNGVIFIKENTSGNTLSTGYNDSLITALTIYKLSEKTGLSLAETKKTNGNYTYPFTAKFRELQFRSNNYFTISNESSLSNTIAAANSSIASCEGYQVITALNAPKSDSIFFLGKSTDKNKTYTTQTKCYAYKIQLATENQTVPSARVSSSTLNSLLIVESNPPVNSIYAKHYDFADAYAPVIEFNGQNVSISKSSNPEKIPILCYDSVKSDSSGNVTLGTSFACFNADNNAPLQQVTLTSISNGETITVNPWFEDDSSVILGLYPSNEYNNQYVITYKEGSYTKANWLNDAFDVWIIIDDSYPRFTKTTKKITDIADEIIL